MLQHGISRQQEAVARWRAASAAALFQPRGGGALSHARLPSGRRCSDRCRLPRTFRCISFWSFPASSRSPSHGTRRSRRAARRRVSRASSRPPVHRRANRDGLAAALAAHYGIARQTDWPMAPLRLAALGVDPGDAYWLAADPVTLVAGRDDARVGAAMRDLHRAESGCADRDAERALRRRRSRCSSRRGPTHGSCARRPCPRCRRGRSTRCRGKSLRTQMPTGADAKTWWRWQEEIQMLLFTHPVTAAREREGRAVANGVWLSTGGTRPPPPAGPAASIATFAGDDTAVALAAHVGAIARPLPAHLDAALEHAGARAIDRRRRSPHRSTSRSSIARLRRPLRRRSRAARSRA